MRRLCLWLAFQVVILFGSVSSVQASIKFRDANLLYTSDLTAFQRDAVEPLFERLLRGNRPIVLFIHGRGKEPGKSLQGTGFFARLAGVEGKAVEKLEAYGTTVVLVSWDSERGEGLRDRSRALSNMPASATRLAFVIEQFDRALRASEASGSPHPPVTLLAHSMGTIVLQTYVQSNTSGWPKAGHKLFNTVVLSSADADDVGHASWVNEIAGLERVFVTINPDDPTLLESTDSRPSSAHALGLGAGANVALSANYVQFREKAHEVFTQRANRSDVSNFFAAVFKDGTIPLGDAVTTAPGHQFQLLH